MHRHEMKFFYPLYEANWPTRKPNHMTLAPLILCSNRLSPQGTKLLPEHWLMPVRFSSSSHILSSQSSDHNSMIMVLYPPPTQLYIVETCGISCLWRQTCYMSIWFKKGKLRTENKLWGFKKMLVTLTNIFHPQVGIIPTVSKTGTLPFLKIH